MKNYQPNPIDTSKIIIDDEIKAAIDAYYEQYGAGKRG